MPSFIEEALLEAVNAGKVGAALDVFVSKTPFEDEVTTCLIKSERVMVTPHSIGQSHEAIEEKGEGVIKAIEDHVKQQE